MGLYAIVLVIAAVICAYARTFSRLIFFKWFREETFERDIETIHMQFCFVSRDDSNGANENCWKLSLDVQFLDV